MIMPVQKLIEYSENSYELTTAITHRAFQLAVIHTGVDGERKYAKAVSLATKEIFDKEVEYHFIE